MKRSLIYIAGLALLTTGCATTRNPSAVSQLQIQVNQMERKLEERDRDIEELKFTVNNLSAQLDESNTYSMDSSVEDMDLSAGTTRTASKTTTADDSIIRVAETPQTIQTALKSAGYYTGSIDGKMGAGSRQAIKEFQKDHNLKVDGIVGKGTWAELKNYLE